MSIVEEELHIRPESIPSLSARSPNTSAGFPGPRGSFPEVLTRFPRPQATSPKVREGLLTDRENLPEPWAVLPEPRATLPKTRESLPTDRESLPESWESSPTPSSGYPKPSETSPMPRQSPSNVHEEDFHHTGNETMAPVDRVELRVTRQQIILLGFVGSYPCSRAGTGICRVTPPGPTRPTAYKPGLLFHSKPLASPPKIRFVFPSRTSASAIESR
uniref:Uncharacterized protein n=1 Tax=Candidatus Kentrum sp. LFY TaxID=2126342 RepID=A0A450UJU3_9GAMM|nr:MAG: hypothetical protein BECKLFY1418A_GA0070994_102636 [Candidatus Kentron sp. LFY]